MTAPTATPSSAQLAAAFEAEARRLHREFRTPGVSLALLLPGGDYFVNLGVASLETNQPVTEDTIFQIGSTTKTLTSLVCSTLVAEGKLDLDGRVREYLPDFKLRDEHAAEHATVRDLLTHQGGWLGDLFEDTGDGDDALARGLDKLADSPQMVPLRGHWSYNNAGFFVAGRIIEVLTGQTWEQTVTERVFTPLGMDHSFFFANQIMTWRFAVGYNKIGEEFKPQRPWMMMRSAAPAGSTCSSTAVDMAKYAHYIMEGTMNPRPAPDVKAEGGKADQDAAPAEAAPPTAPAAPILASVDRHSLWATRIPIGNAFNGFPGERGQMGQSWFVDDYGHTTILSHGGTTVGHQSDFWVSPDRQVGFISLTNGSNGHALNRQLSEWVKREVLGLMAPELGSHEHDEAGLADFTGVYDVVGQTYTLEVSAQNGALVVRMPDPASGGTLDLGLTFIEPERAVIADGNYAGLGVEFLRNGSGAVDFMRFGGRIYPRQVQAQATPDSAQPTPEVVSQV
ncbi:beta-lactamase family protein [Deinococcus sp. KSM4-11]|uniref:serine hydrolase domain-containing protein n=1 Tax=Deinococcus sp. KSM4-11 TaxID=2568654 RepID=UPI0010A2FD62|nr:serine hydrolase domain-containing protein [Deinococcus sp. KSM4-11]THF85307.1 beta-lactamase family protein [Deinococcus sp. KSM4-11]